ncbi:MAG: phosphoribosylanthranilate isomerase, partial [Thermodesulfobacteriota bacterium]
MQKIIVQIYEIQDAAEAGKLVEIGVDHIGSVIVSAADWKEPGVKETIDLIRQSDSRSSLILLFHDPQTVYRALDYYQPHIVHFCEALSHTNGIPDEFCHRLFQLQADIRDRYPQLRIMRSIPMGRQPAVAASAYREMAALFEPVSDFFLTDTVLPGDGDTTGENQPVQGFVGITGKTCDWRAARILVQTSRIPVILAGGLSPGNVGDGIRQVGPA